MFEDVVSVQKLVLYLLCSHASPFRLKRALRFIKRSLDAEEAVYIHCESGVHRAPSVVAAAVMCEMGIAYDQAESWRQ